MTLDRSFFLGAFLEEIYLPRWRRISSLHQKYKLVARIGTGAGKDLGGWDPNLLFDAQMTRIFQGRQRRIGCRSRLDKMVLKSTQFHRNELMQVGYVFSDKTGGRCWRSMAPTSLILRHCHGMSGWKCSAIFISCNPYLCKFASNLQWQINVSKWIMVEESKTKTSKSGWPEYHLPPWRRRSRHFDAEWHGSKAGCRLDLHDSPQ